jgi:hypothetical protein
LVSPHEATSGVKQWQLATPVLSPLGAHQFQGSGAAPLMLTASAACKKLQVAGAVPWIKSMHGGTLDANTPQLCSKRYQTMVCCLGSLCFVISLVV